MDKLACKDIGIEDCNFATHAEAGENTLALDEMLRHLEKRHGYHLTVGDVLAQSFENLSLPERTLAARLHHQLTEMAI